MNLKVLLTAVFPMYRDGADKINVSSAPTNSLSSGCLCCLQEMLLYLWVACYLDLEHSSEITPYSNTIQMQIAPSYFYIYQLRSLDSGLWSNQLSHFSSVGSLMCQDPEIAFVLIVLPFKRTQFACHLMS